MNAPALRRRVLVQGALAAAAAAAAGLAEAQSPRRYVVVALIGDRVELVLSQNAIGSNIDRNRREGFDDSSGTLDRDALLATSQEVERLDRGAFVQMLGMPPSPWHNAPGRLFDGDSVVLPDNVVQALDRARATHLLLITKYRANSRIQLRNDTVGTGSLSGLGIYVDRATQLTVRETGQTGQGLLAPFAYIRLTLADAQTGAVIKQLPITASDAFSVAGSDKAATPWDVLSNEEKVKQLRSLLQRELTQAVPGLLAPLLAPSR